MKKTLSIAIFSLLTLAAAQKIQTVYINGQPVQAISTTVNGKPGLSFVTSDLQKTGALTQGGSKAVDAIQGCKGQPLFNGVLRVMLLSAGEGKDKSSGDPEYQVVFKIVNGINKEIDPNMDAMFSYRNVWLADDTGQSKQMSYWMDDMEGNDSLLPGSNKTIGIAVGTLGFKPTRVLWRPPADSNSLPWAKVRNMEFKLECK